MSHRYFIVNKPYNMVSQFISPHRVRLLADLDFDFPAGTHAIGRLDNNSEGLLILTTNKAITRLLFQNKTAHKRTYLVQVKNIVSKEGLSRLKNGVTFRINGGANYIAAPHEVSIVERPEILLATNFEIPTHLPHTWLQLTLIEGKYHQVRKMVAAVSHPCRRLVRLSIEELCLGNLQPGCVEELEEEVFFTKLKLEQGTMNREQ